MSDNFNVQELIKMKKLPIDGALPVNVKKRGLYRGRKGNNSEGEYNLDDTEEAVTYPYYAPTEIAFIFHSKQGKVPWFRKSESEKTYSKDTLLKEYGVKPSDFRNVNSVATEFCSKEKKQVDYYTLSSFKNFNQVVDGFGNWYEKLVNSCIRTHEKSMSKLHSSYDYEVTLNEKLIRIDFGLVYINLNVDLKNICQQKIKSKSANPKEDLRQQVIMPLTFLIDQIKHSLLSELEGAIILDEHNINVNSIEKSDIKRSISNFLLELKKEKSKQIVHKSLMSKKPYHELFPCRENVRKITIFVAPTNSGKTYHSCNRIKDMIMEDDRTTAQCFFPLRALAAQLKDEFVENGFPCDLITGEEREFEDDARITCCTTEVIDPGEYKDIIFIDECQMIFDRNKQAAYTRAILGAHCDQLLLAVAPYYADALVKVIEKYTSDEIEIVNLERLCPLNPCGPLKLEDVEKGDVVVAYRTKSIHLIAEALKNQGLKVGVIYGRMSPSARRSMIKEFMDSDCDCLVATDAIGMGLSIPAKRVLIAEGTKYDGISIRPLEEEEMRQVAGRAGRFKFYDEGFYGTLDISSIMEKYTPLNFKVLEESIVIKEAFTTSSQLNVAPDKNVIRSVKDLNLEATLKIWKDSVSIHKDIEVCKETFDYLLMKAKFLDETVIEDRDLLVSLLFIVFPEERNNTWEKAYKDMVNSVIKEKRLTFGYYHSLNTGDYVSDIKDFEDYSLYLTLLSQFQRIFPELTPDEDDIRQKQDENGEMLSSLLLRMYASKP
jgi:hypothetical protein